jgi:hypothetical protein
MQTFYYHNDRCWTIPQLAKHYGINVGTLHKRLKRLPVDEAVSSPVMNRSQIGHCGALKSGWRYSEQRHRQVKAALAHRMKITCNLPASSEKS